MKKLITLITLISLIIFNISCSSDNEESPTNTQQDNNNDDPVANLTLIKKINENPSLGSNYIEDFFYLEDKLNAQNTDGEIDYFEYNTNLQISSRTECADQNVPANQDLNQYNCQDFFESRVYNYNGNRLSSIESGNNIDTFSYNTGGFIISITDSPDSNPSNDNEYYAYDSNGVISTRTSANGNTVRTFEWDGMINPYNGLWQAFGYFKNSNVEPYDIIPAFAKHNPTKIFKNGELELEATYTYNSDGYPLTCSFIRYSNNSISSEGDIVFSY